jgi:hypothetical protein
MYDYGSLMAPNDLAHLFMYLYIHTRLSGSFSDCSGPANFLWPEKNSEKEEARARHWPSGSQKRIEGKCKKPRQCLICHWLSRKSTASARDNAPWRPLYLWTTDAAASSAADGLAENKGHHCPAKMPFCCCSAEEEPPRSTPPSRAAQ